MDCRVKTMAQGGNIIAADHLIEVALICPQIAPNTGNVARLCVATGARLHLVRPMGFVLSDRQLRRSAMDYWPRLKLIVHDDVGAFLEAMGGRRMWCFSSKAGKVFWDARFERGDCLVFGNETHGLEGISDAILSREPQRIIRIPQAEGERCLNLATAAGIGVYEAMRQLALCER